MRSNSLEDALKTFLENNPDLPEGSENVIPEITASSKNKITLHVLVEKKGRGGKTATIIEGLSQLPLEEVESLAKEIKKKLGTGGSWREEEILIQGNRLNDVVLFLKQKGYIVK